MSLSSILLFIVILLALVLVHEFGHFLVAKLVGMRVDEFAFGFPPRLFAKKKGETTYAVNAIPLGGYVSIWGENGEPGDEAKHHPRAFGNRPKWAQLLVLVAGVTMNMIFAFAIFVFISYGNVEMSTTDPQYGARVKNPVMMVVEAAPSSPAYLAGIVPGSVIKKLSNGGQVADLQTATSVVAFIEAHQNSPFSITYTKPDGQTSATTVAAVYGIVPDKKALGVSLDTVGVFHTSFLQAVKIGYWRTYDMTALTFDGFKSVLASIGKKGALESLSGPIGIVSLVGTSESYGLVAVLTLAALLSINLAIFNILPLPALDGGRMVVVLIEAVANRRVPFKYYSWVNIVGFSALMFLLLLVSIQDVLKLVHL